MKTSRRVLDFQRLAVYQKTLDLIVLCDRLTPSSTEARRHLGWQLHRAAASIALNLAEGSGRYRNPDKARFFVISTGSAMECAAILDIADRLSVGQPDLRREGQALLDDIIPMLVGLTRSVRARSRP